jgi:hypothetical protein
MFILETGAVMKNTISSKKRTEGKINLGGNLTGFVK